MKDHGWRGLAIGATVLAVFVVGGCAVDADGKTLGCLAVPLADGSDPPDSLSDLEPCPTGTPKTSE